MRRIRRLITASEACGRLNTALERTLNSVLPCALCISLPAGRCVEIFMVNQRADPIYSQFPRQARNAGEKVNSGMKKGICPAEQS